MKRFVLIGLAALCATYCSSGEVELETSTTKQMTGSQAQGPELHGFDLQGDVEDMTMRGFQFSGATLNGSALTNVRIEQGELVAEQGSATLHADDLEGARLIAQVKDMSANPPEIHTVEYRITAVEEEDDDYDPTDTGETYLYTLEQNVDGNGDWQPACPLDADDRRVAIPLTDFYDETGARVDSSTLFTFSCTRGAIAKCYRWGYRPWLTGFGTSMEDMHWTCTRLARADYCGTGASYTYEGTEINVWDSLPSPGPIQSHGSTPSGMVFEAGWNTGGAVCFSAQRWLLVNGGPLIAVLCPNRLILPVPLLVPGTLCNDDEDVIELYPTAKMFNETKLNINLPLFPPL
jgi:hypothetical protein